MRSLKNIITLLWILVHISCQSGGKAQSEIGEKYRPLFHFSPPSMWMNDPNGMVFFEGEYHLFYQYYPDSTVWGPMHWGHAVSTDLITWEHFPIALYPDSLGYIFSGSAVVDWQNSSGFGTWDNPPLVAIFTYHNPDLLTDTSLDHQYQGIAYSIDKGRTWIKNESLVLANPGIRDFRDPKVFWYEPESKWLMVLAVLDHVSFYSSTDLKSWQHESDFGKEWGSHAGVWECPDLFELKVEGESYSKWVLLLSINPGGPLGGSATQYFVGDFDGSAFTLDSAMLHVWKSIGTDTLTERTIWMDHGADNYAGVTWGDIPADDGRRIFLGWMGNWDYAQVVPTKSWRSAMTLPRKLTLIQNANGYQLKQWPVRELDRYIGDEAVTDGPDISLTDSTYLLRLSGASGQGSVTFSNDLNEKVVIVFVGNQLSFDRTNSGKTDFSPSFPAVHSITLSGMTITDISIYVDVASMELFVNSGEMVITEIVFPTSPYSKVSVSGFGIAGVSAIKF